MSERVIDSEIEGNGHEPESQEQINAAFKKLQELRRGDGSVVSLGKQELTLLQTALRTATEKSKEDTIFRMCRFLDEDNAQDHVAAYEEAKDLGMDTGYNVRLMFALCSVESKAQWNNLLGQVLDTLQHGKWAMTMKGKGNGGYNPRSPLASPS